MAWTPSQPPAHTGSTTTNAGVFPWDDFRFVLVKLDNETIQLLKPSWACPHSQASASRNNQVTRYAGAAGTLTAGYGFGAAAIGGNCGGYGVTWTGTGHGAASSCAQGGTPGGLDPTGTTKIEARACIPWRSGSFGIVIANAWANNTPGSGTGGFSTMAECANGYQAGGS